MDFWTIITEIARRKTGISGWEIEKRSHRDGNVYVTGSEPEIHPGNGRKIWPTEKIKCVITPADLDTFRREWEVEHNLCFGCEGSKIGWRLTNPDIFSGDPKFVLTDCPSCHGTGKPTA